MFYKWSRSHDQIDSYKCPYMVKNLKIFSGTVGPISLERGIKVCINGPSHMTKMVALPIYCENLKNLFFFGKGWTDFNESWYEAFGTRGQGYIYLDQHDFSRRSFIKDQISVERCKDLWSPDFKSHLRKI